MNTFSHFVMYRLQEGALLFLVAVYALRLVWLHRRFRAAWDRQPRAERPGTGPLKGAMYSMGVIGRPWHLESARRHPVLYSQFVLFHLGVAAAIAYSVIRPYAPEWLDVPPFRWLLTAVIGVGVVVSMMRFFRRVGQLSMRAISTFDDYFSLGLLTVWLTLALFNVGIPGAADWVRDGFFLLTAFFLFYVPFSKISHYLYYPLSRYFLGRTLGWRGVYPLVRVPVQQSSRRRSVR